MIPDWAARDICDVANLTTLDMAAIEADAARTLAPILSLTRALATAAGPAGDYVHWGATTQNVMQTGLFLLLGLGIFLIVRDTTQLEIFQHLMP